jgi:hypothetical protein
MANNPTLSSHKQSSHMSIDDSPCDSLAVGSAGAAIYVLGAAQVAPFTVGSTSISTEGMKVKDDQSLRPITQMLSTGWSRSFL